jgi:hypothetical protein
MGDAERVAGSTDETEREVTVRVPLEEVADLLEDPPRACLAMALDGRPRVEPVAFRYEEGRFLAGLDAGTTHLAPGAEAVLVVDGGTLFFDLRAVYVRGSARPRAGDARDGLAWFEIAPSSVASWDYGRMRVERGRD